MSPKAWRVATTDVISRFTTWRGSLDAGPRPQRYQRRPLCRSCRDRMDPHTKKVPLEPLVIFSPPILTALQAGACTYLSTALCNFHPQGVWKRCVALHAPEALRGAGASVMRDQRSQRSGVVAASPPWACLPTPVCRCAAKDGRLQLAAPLLRTGDAPADTHQSVMTCGTKREVSRVIGPASSRMPNPAGRSATTQLPTNAWRPSNTGSG